MMMKLNLKTKYKSLEPIQIDFPDFVVLTGLNGAGKTQLLNAIQTNVAQLTDENGRALNPKKYVNSSNLIPNNITDVALEQLNEQSLNLWQQFSQSYLDKKKINPNFQLQDLYGTPDASEIKTIKKIAVLAKKEIDKLNLDDFCNYYPLEEGLQHNDIFQQDFTNLFKKYQDKLDDNEFHQFKNRKKGLKNISFLTDSQFLEAFGEPPWLFVNKIIKEANLDYHIKVPEYNNRGAPFVLKLVNNNSNSEINFVDLSSGEKVLMSLALALCNSKFDLQFPKVLLMDEPDASLHPSMSKKLIDVIQQVFVKEKRVKVIITTHSPSTIALSPKEAIYIVNKSGIRIEKASKDVALSILTSGLPSLSINYENRRQVFVESKYDVTYFEKIFKKLIPLLQPEISLTFISAGESRTDKNGKGIANCEQVVNITNILRDAGSNSVFGIIDWDLTNSSTEFVKVLGQNNRYSIETFLFDPILIGAFLLRERIVSKEELGLNESQNYTDIKTFDVEKIQSIIDFVINSLTSEFNININEKNNVKYVNGMTVNIPKWYLHNQGHELEEKIINKYPKLNKIKKNKEDLLKLEIIDKIIDDLPEFIPMDFLEIFKEIQK